MLFVVFLRAEFDVFDCIKRHLSLSLSLEMNEITLVNLNEAFEIVEVKHSVTNESAERDSGGLGGRVGWREGESAAVLLPRVPGDIQVPSDCHVIVPLRWQCVCLVDIVEACWEAMKEV